MLLLTALLGFCYKTIPSIFCPQQRKFKNKFVAEGDLDSCSLIQSKSSCSPNVTSGWHFPPQPQLSPEEHCSLLATSMISHRWTFLDAYSRYHRWVTATWQRRAVQLPVPHGPVGKSTAKALPPNPTAAPVPVEWAAAYCAVRWGLLKSWRALKRLRLNVSCDGYIASWDIEQPLIYLKGNLIPCGHIWFHKI